MLGKILNKASSSLGKKLDHYDFKPSEGGKPYYLLLDTETSGLPRYRTLNYQESGVFPRIIQLAYMVLDEAGHLIEKEAVYLNIDVKIDPGAYKVHRIDHHKLAAHGKPPEIVYAGIADNLRKAKVIVAHNQEFDVPILQSELWRFGYDVEELFLDKEFICTMISTKAFVGIKHAYGGYKYPKLVELYGKLFHNDTTAAIVGTHDADVDIMILGRCFLELSSRGIIDTEIVKKRTSNRQFVRQYFEDRENLLTLHTREDSLLVYQNLSSDEIKYLSGSGQEKFTEGIYNKLNINPIYQSFFNQVNIVCRDGGVEISINVDIEKLLSPNYPQAIRKGDELRWKDYSRSSYYELQGKIVFSLVLKVVRDMINQHPSINFVETILLSRTVDKALGIEQDGEFVRVSIDKESFGKINLAKADPMETILYYNPKMKYLKTKGFQLLQRKS